MNNIPQPAFNVKNVIDKLTTEISGADESLFKDEERKYQENISNNICAISQNATLGSLTQEQLKDLYEKDFVAHVKPRRAYYQTILESSRFCPFCGIRDPDAVDHFLPKAVYSSLSIVPSNLIPICTKCNQKKSNCTPQTGNLFFFHPYYNPIGDWLKFNLIQDGTSIIFKLQPIDTTIEGYSKIKYTLDHLELVTKIEARALQKYNDKKDRLINLKKRYPDYENFSRILSCDIVAKTNDIENSLNKCLYENSRIIFDVLRTT